jgi:hypothetical protein
MNWNKGAVINVGGGTEDISELVIHFHVPSFFPNNILIMPPLRILFIFIAPPHPGSGCFLFSLSCSPGYPLPIYCILEIQIYIGVCYIVCAVTVLCTCFLCHACRLYSHVLVGRYLDCFCQSILTTFIE